VLRLGSDAKRSPDQDRKAEQINAEGGGGPPQIIYNPNLSMIKILIRNSVTAHQAAMSDGPIVNMSDGNFCRIKYSARAKRIIASPPFPEAA